MCIWTPTSSTATNHWHRQCRATPSSLTSQWSNNFEICRFSRPRWLCAITHILAATLSRPSVCSPAHGGATTNNSPYRKHAHTTTTSIYYYWKTRKKEKQQQMKQTNKRKETTNTAMYEGKHAKFVSRSSGRITAKKNKENEKRKVFL